MYFKKNYNEIVSSVLEHMIRGMTKEKHTFHRTKLIYDLQCRPEFRPVKKLSQVEGFLNSAKHIFKPERDYVLKDNALQWLNNASDIPDEKSTFDVSYSFENHSALSDINVGSVLRTLVESISREIEFVYDEMESVYNSAFIDTATGDSLDLVVSILGIKRKDPTRASGVVVFIRDTDPPAVTNSEVILYDGREIYDLKVKHVIKVLSLTSSLKDEKYTFVEGKDYSIESDSIRWLAEGDKPDDKKEFTVEYSSFQPVKIPGGTVVSTLPQRNQTELSFQTTEDFLLQKVGGGKWEADVPVQSLIEGTQGNVLPGTIKIMPVPIEGVDKVINRSSLVGGAPSEDDVSLRVRAKKILDVKGKATLESLRTALEGIEGIQTAPVLIDMPEGVQGVVKAIIDGGDNAAIEKVIEETRAAGVKVEYYRPKMVMLDIDVVLLASKTVEDVQRIISTSESIIKTFVSSLGIGESLVINQLVSLLLETSNVIDVRALDIKTVRESLSPGQEVPKSSSAENPIGTEPSQRDNNIIISEEERPYLREVKVKVVRQSK